MRPHELRNTTIAAVILTALAFTPMATAAAKKPKHTTKEIMKEILKGDDSIGKRVAQGKASKADIDKMVEYYASLPLNDPPRGDKESWLAKTTALVKASQEVKAGKPNALEHLKEASNCKACHSVHKPEEKK